MKETINRITTIATVVCMVTITLLVIRREFFTPVPSNRVSRPEPVEQWEELTRAGHRIGPVDAPITMVAFADFECSFCARFALEIMPELNDRYPGLLSVVYRHWPLDYHRFAYPAARAAECAAEQGRFEEFYIRVYQVRVADSLGMKAFRDIASEAGVPDMKAFDDCNEQRGKHPAIEADIAAAKRVGATGTPTIVLNGWKYRGAAFAPLDSAITAELGKRQTAGR